MMSHEQGTGPSPSHRSKQPKSQRNQFSPRSKVGTVMSTPINILNFTSDVPKHISVIEDSLVEKSHIQIDSQECGSIFVGE
jgi:hypothetical protein